MFCQIFFFFWSILLVTLFGRSLKMHLKGVKQFQIQSVTGSIACSTDVGNQLGVTNRLWKVLEEDIG